MLSLFTDLDPWIKALLELLLLGLIGFALRSLVRWMLLTFVVNPIRLNTDKDNKKEIIIWLSVLLDRTVLERTVAIIPSVVVQIGIYYLQHLSSDLRNTISNIAVALTALHIVRALIALLDALQNARENKIISNVAPTRSIKSYLQLGKLLLCLIGAVVIAGALLNRSPLILLSGLGAMSAVLMLIFKDTILSFTAGVQLASNDMLRVGDWIEMPQVGADGDVIDIALHTVKVQNWDKTITSIPTWRLMSESYRNWRGMFGSGGRRIKRTLRLDTGSVRFLTFEDIKRLSHIALLTSYLSDKMRDVEKTNVVLLQKMGSVANHPANQRRITNIGTFRAYVEAWLRANPLINHNMTLMVRMLEPSTQGAPMELYCFTATTAWVEYEGIQADIFDHLLAILPEFDLRLFQSPTGRDMYAALQSGRNVFDE